MSNRRSILIVSNGYGEDAVGAALAAALASVPAVVYPLVGMGRAYGDLPVLSPRRNLPSEGFGLRGAWSALWADLRAGAVRHWMEQRRTLSRRRGAHDLVVAIGDVYGLWMAARAGRPLVFVATAKSVYNEPYRPWERRLMRALTQRVYARDQATAEGLVQAHVPATWVGNPLMDTIPPGGDPPPLLPGRPVVTLLPGSRMEAYDNLPLLLPLCEAVGRQIPVNFLCALAPTVDWGRMVNVARGAGWKAAGDEVTSAGAAIRRTGEFGAALRAAVVVVGLAGTANEQAAGLGKPVVAFPGPGPQYTRRFMALQQRLLGDALVSTPGWREAADEVVRLLSDQDECRRRGESGRLRMGPPGAVQRIAAELAAMLATGAG